jgi:hypothetical protein
MTRNQTNSNSRNRLAEWKTADFKDGADVGGRIAVGAIARHRRQVCAFAMVRAAGCKLVISNGNIQNPQSKIAWLGRLHSRQRLFLQLIHVANDFRDRGVLLGGDLLAEIDIGVEGAG